MYLTFKHVIETGKEKCRHGEGENWFSYCVGGAIQTLKAATPTKINIGLP